LQFRGTISGFIDALTIINVASFKKVTWSFIGAFFLGVEATNLSIARINGTEIVILACNSIIAASKSISNFGANIFSTGIAIITRVGIVDTSSVSVICIHIANSRSADGSGADNRFQNAITIGVLSDHTGDRGTTFTNLAWCTRTNFGGATCRSTQTIRIRNTGGAIGGGISAGIWIGHSWICASTGNTRVV
jgi:hypothetical protein